MKRRQNRQQRRLRERQEAREKAVAQELLERAATPEERHHVLEQIVAPTERARELRDQGLDVSILPANTNLASPGYLLTCVGCSRQVIVQTKIPEGLQALCPSCVKG
jgi:hypothetical protein